VNPYKIVPLHGIFHIKCLYYVAGAVFPWQWRYLDSTGKGKEFPEDREDCFTFTSAELAEEFINKRFDF
jgi:hypothetical protein